VNKKLGIVLIIMMSLSILVCAKEIDVWLTGHSNEEMSILKEITETRFTADTGIDVNYTVLSWGDFENRFLLAAASNEAPDVGGAGALFLPELGLRGALMDLSNLPGFDEVQKRAYPGFYRPLQYQGLTFGIPYTSRATIAFQRDDILSELGISRINTWDELKQVLPKMQARGSNFAMQWYLTTTLYADVNNMMWQRGADDYNEDLTKSGYDDPQAVYAFKDFVELYTKYKIAMDVPQFQAFSTGDLAILLYYPNFYQNVRLAAPQLAGKWSVTQAPGYIINGKLNNTTTGDGPAIGIFNSSKKKSEAWEFIKWITSEDIQLELSTRIMNQIQGSLFLPSNRYALQKVDLPEDALKVIHDSIEKATCSVYGLVAPRHRRRYLQMAAQKAILQGMDPEKAIREAADEHNSEISRKQSEYDRFIKRLLEEQKKGK
jgi:ABC-type glycerol-3-phosphate transport system substrate-binding protein